MEIHNGAATRKTENDSKWIDWPATEKQICPKCSEPFDARKGSGGKQQKFCSPECRQAFHAEERKNENNREGGPDLKPQRSQRAPTCTLPTAEEATPAPEPTPNSPANPSEAISEFSWSDEDSLLVMEQRKTAAYWNPNGDLVIRQKNWPDEDSFVIISADRVGDFIDKLTDVIGIPSFP